MYVSHTVVGAMGRKSGWVTITDAPESFSWKVKSSTVDSGLAGDTTPPIYKKWGKGNLGGYIWQKVRIIWYFIYQQQLHQWQQSHNQSNIKKKIRKILH